MSEETTSTSNQRPEHDIEFFATLPASVDPDDQEAVTAWLEKLADALSRHDEIRVERTSPRRGMPSEDPGTWFRILEELEHPICPGRVTHDGDDEGEAQGDDDGGGEGGGGSGADART